MPTYRDFHTQKLEVYFLPFGGEKGKDEIPIHSNTSSLSVQHHQDAVDADMGGYRVAIPTTTRWTEIDLETMGAPRDMPYMIKPGERGTITILAGHKPHARHVDVILTDLSFGNSFSDVWSYQARWLSTGALFDGTYTVKRRYATIQTDLGDGTFLEHYLHHDIPLDQLIDNRYHGW